MKRKWTVIFAFLLTFLFIGTMWYLYSLNREYPDDENTLYSVKFDDVRMRFERIDYALGQNQLVVVEKSTNRGKTFEQVTQNFLTLSMEPKFIFYDKLFGFAISKPNLSKNNNYMGVYVTLDGGKTFELSQINYDQPDIEVLTVLDVPYFEDDLLILPCSIYKIKEDDSGYEDVDLFFVSDDRGLTWNLKN